MWKLRERFILSFRKHYGNVAFESSLNVVKQEVTFEKQCYTVKNIVGLT